MPWLAYDTKFRLKVAAQKWPGLTNIDTTLRTLAFVSTGPRERRSTAFRLTILLRMQKEARARGAECKITAGHWPISSISLNRQSKFQHGAYMSIHFVHMANQIHEELEKWPTT